MDLEEAERTKIVLGLPGHTRLDLYAGVAGTEPPTAAEEHPAHQAIAEEVAGLVTELRATLDYFRTSTGGEAPLSRLLLAGRASALGGLAEVIAERTGLPVERLAVLEQVHQPRRMLLLPDQETELTVPAGLCLGEVS